MFRPASARVGFVAFRDHLGQSIAAHLSGMPHVRSNEAALGYATPYVRPQGRRFLAHDL
jgi:hypothetical protein